MKQIQLHRDTKQSVLQGAIEILKPVMLILKQNENQIGAQLSQSITRSRLDERTIGRCLKCQTGKLVILHSKKTGKRFVGCTNYFKGKCDLSFPLPQTGTIRSSAATCKSCGCPIIKVWMNPKQPWSLCLNPNCPAKEPKKP